MSGYRALRGGGSSSLGGPAPGTYAGSEFLSFITGAPSANALSASPVALTAGTYDRLAISVTTGAADAEIRLGLYEDDNGRPGALIVDGGPVSAASTGIIAATINAVLAGGAYWLAAVGQGAGVESCQVTQAREILGAGVAVSRSDTIFTQHNVLMSVSGVSGALPDPYGEGSSSRQAIVMRIRRAP